ncbi:MAG: hypothetical protein IPM18_13260 [Phycisphaerales bacterium]|nr:hypothetical protein [Phycisphaerales bacterium]
MLVDARHLCYIAIAMACNSPGRAPLIHLPLQWIALLRAGWRNSALHIRVCSSWLLVAGLAWSAAAVIAGQADPPSDLRPLQLWQGGRWVGNAISYGPHRDGQAPGGAQPSEAQLAEDLDLLARHWGLLRMYAAGGAAESVVRLIHERKLGMQVLLGAWIAPESGPEAVSANRREVACAIQLANAYPDVVIGVSVGNETQVSWSAHRVAPDVLIPYLREVRARTRVPVTTADDYTFWLEPRSREIAAEVDFIATHIYAMWRGVQLEDAVAFTQREFAMVQAAHPAHPIVLTEVGWATKRHTEGEEARHIRGRAGTVEQAQFYADFLAWTTRQQVPNFYFQAFDEKWKGGAHPDEVEKHWGLFESDRTPKLALRSQTARVTQDWQQRVTALAWICYNPTHSNPQENSYADTPEVRADLTILRKGGFSGLITYGCKPERLREIIPLAAAAGFRGVILGVWDPLDEEELAHARALGAHELVLGVCVGNEGLGQRYSFEQLVVAMDRLRSAIHKPVTTTEEIGDYVEARVLHVGDWVFPNAHPVYHHCSTVEAAVRWTRGAYEDLQRRADRFVWLKEVGWPTAGGATYTPAAQREYYEQLATYPLVFAYFEAFDQTWKEWRAFEPHFGLYDAGRVAKPLAAAFQANGPPPQTVPAHPAPTSQPAGETAPRPPFCVYRDAHAPQNHFTPTGRQGDAGDVHVDEAWRTNPRSGDTCIKLTLAVRGAGPNLCDYGPPCRWAGLRWLHPAHNWGRDEAHAGVGFDLRGYRRLTFWARAAAPGTVSFTVGGVDTEYGDSLAFPATAVHRIDTDWRQYSIDLTGCDLRHVIAGFGCSSSWDVNPSGLTIYLDDIYFE